MNWLDLLLVTILVLSLASSFSKGFVRELIGLAAAMAGLFCGAWFYRLVGVNLQPYVGSRQAANLCGFLLIFAGVIVVGWIVSLLVGMVVKAVGLSWLDRLMGAGFGVARGAIVCVAVITAMVAFAPGKSPPQSVVHSKIAPYMIDAAHALTMAAPRELRDEFARRYDQVKRVWEDAMRHGLQRLPESEI
jgi:membrane protein required for colicin V production